MTRRKPYLVYLIRLWPAEEGAEPAWRASLESARSGEKYGFASLEQLFDFLRTQVREQAQPPGQPGEVPGEGRL